MKSTSKIHDHSLIGYEVNSVDRTIVLRTESPDESKPLQIDVLFTGVQAYDFRNDSFATTLNDIAEVALKPFIDEHLSEFQKGWNQSGWTGEWSSSHEKAFEFLSQKKIKAFEISSSIGLSGWVLATDIRSIEVS